MNKKQLEDILECAQLGLSDKDTIMEAINSASQSLEDIQAKIKDVSSDIEMAEFELQYAGEDAQKHREIADKYGLQPENEERLEELKQEEAYYTNLITSLEKELGDFKNFNRRTFLKNVRFLLNEKPDVKIGQIEKEAGVSLGYMSRLEKDKSTTDPSIEFIVTAAKRLDVSTDVLLFTDLTALNPTEKYLVTFLQKLIKDTIDDNLDWLRESKGELDRMEPDMNGWIAHPLFSEETFYEEGETDYPEQVTRVVFTSRTFDCCTALVDDVFCLNMKNHSTLYLMDISKSVYRIGDPTAFAKEIWIDTPGMSAQFLVSNRDIKQIAEQVEKLFAVVKSSMKHPKVKKEVRSVIDAFMNGDLGENDPEEMPFN